MQHDNAFDEVWQKFRQGARDDGDMSTGLLSSLVIDLIKCRYPGQRDVRDELGRDVVADLIGYYGEPRDE